MEVFLQKEHRNSRRPSNWRGHFRLQNCGHQVYGHEDFLIELQRDSRESIRANHSQLKPLFYSASGRFQRITRISDSPESPDSRESRCESLEFFARISQGFSRFRSFKKGLADRGGWREEILLLLEIGLISVPSFLCPLRRRGTYFWRIFWGFVCRQPPPANPFSKPLVDLF